MIKIISNDGRGRPYLFCDYSGEPIDDPAMANVIWLEDDLPDGSVRMASPVCHVLKQFDFPKIREKLLAPKEEQVCCWLGLDVFLALLLQNCGFDSKAAESAVRRKRRMDILQG